MNFDLGSYYIDMRPAIIHYKNDLYKGTFDENGVPMTGNKEGLYYFSIHIAQYGFMLHADWLESRTPETLIILKNCLAKLESLKIVKGDTCAWYTDVYNERYEIDSHWPSAMAQGEVISFYLRMYQILKEEELLKTAIQAYNFLKIEYQDGGVRRYDKNGYLWLEEYPSKEPSFVLNGFIYAILGLYDLYRITKALDVKEDIESCILTLRKNLNKFDVGYWSLYDMQKKELVRYYYQKNVHVPQLEILYLLTGEELFLKYKVRWEKQITAFNYFWVQIMYRVRPRILRLKNILKNG